MAFLRVTAGPNSGQICEIKEPECVLGRHADCDVPVNVRSASRYHARIVRIEGDHFLEDLHSRNGTFLNGTPVHGLHKMAEGDRIRIGQVVLTFCDRPVPAPGAEPPSIEEKIKLIVVDDEEQESPFTPVSKRALSSGRPTAPSPLTLQAQLKALLEITHSLRKTLELDRVLPQILDSLFVIFPAAERGFVVLENDEGEVEPRWVKLREGRSESTVRISRTIVRQVMDSQEAILSADAVGDPRFQTSSSLSDVRIRSVMCAPLVDNERRSVGAVQIDTVSDRGRFREEDLEVLVSVATQASIAVDNARLHEYALRDRARERDLEVADQIQRGFLPKSRPRLRDYEFFDYYEPASRVGGDFYDYVTLADGRLAVIVADVVGHGLGAAMLTAKLAAEVRFHLLSAPRPAQAITRLNASLARDLLEGHFVTLAAAVLTPATGEVALVNAGHTRPILRRADGRVAEVAADVSSLPLGIVGDLEYGDCAIQLSPGDLLLVYTDGINEAASESRELFGVDRICQKVQATRGGPQELGQRLVAEVTRFTNGCPQQDDMCLVCFGRE